MSASDHFDFWICYRGPKNKKYVFFIFPCWKIIFVEKMDFLKIWWVSHISHSKTQNSSIDTILLSLIVLEIFHKNYFSTLTLNAVSTPQIWKRGKIKKHVFLIFRSSITYPKIEMIGGGHLKYSPCQWFPNCGSRSLFWEVAVVIFRWGFLALIYSNY